MARPKKDKTNGKASGSPLAKPLARPGDPYVTADGRRFQPTTANGVDVTEAAPKLKAKDFKSTVRRSVKELPAPTNIINGVACVFLYTVMGVGDREIAVALKITDSDVKTIRKSQAYSECFDSIADQFINVNSDHIHARIAAYGHEALSSVAEIAFKGKKEETRLRAGIDLLDRGGYTKKAALIGGGNMNELRITFTKAGEGVDVKIGENNGKAE